MECSAVAGSHREGCVGCATPLERAELCMRALCERVGAHAASAATSAWLVGRALAVTHIPPPPPLPAARRARRFRGTEAVAEAFAVTHPVAPPSPCPSRWFPSHCRRRRPPGDAVAGLPVARPSSPNLVCHAFLIPFNPSRYLSLPPIYCSALVASCAR